jgi:Extensin-like protein C-terminus
MKGGVGLYFVGAGVLLALAGCGRSFMSGERAPWRHQAEVECMRSGSVKLGAGVVQIDPIEGPGMCGADFPLKVSALGESSPLIGYADDPRPPGSIPNTVQMPRWPINEPQFAPPAAIPSVARPERPVNAPRMRWVPGPPPAEQPNTVTPAGRPIPLSAPNAPIPDDIPDDAVTPPARPRPAYAPPRTYDPPTYQPPQQALPSLGRAGGRQTAGPTTPAVLTPPATLACPIVSALDRWVGEGVQPAAMRWFGTPVTEIKQISAYSCRGMVGSGGSGISEHAFGNALDIAAFMFSDGRRVTVEAGWHGTPEEQGFLRDVHLSACDHFSTVLAPGYNAAHYNHIHVDLMRRASGDRPCRPEAMSGEVAAAKARAVYASRQRGPAFTSTTRTNARASRLPAAIPGEDGYMLDDVMINLQSRRGAAHEMQDNDISGAIPPPMPVSKKARSTDDRLTAR